MPLETCYFFYLCFYLGVTNLRLEYAYSETPRAKAMRDTLKKLDIAIDKKKKEIT